jgi:hypothetical protein
MIDPKELRIGNRVKVTIGNDAGIYEVMGIPMWGMDGCGDGIEPLILIDRCPKQLVPPSKLKGIRLTNALLSACGFEGDVWKKKSLGLDMVGPDGFHDLVVGVAQKNSYCAPMIKMGTGDGFTIQQAAEIQKDHAKRHPDEPIMKDESFCPFKMGDSLVLRPVKYLHQLQNLYWCLTGEELEINL